MVKNLRAFLNQTRFKRIALLCGAGVFFCQSVFGTLEQQKKWLSSSKMCEDYNVNISTFCTNNDLLAQAQQNSRVVEQATKLFNSGGTSAVTEQAQSAQQEGLRTEATIQELRQICQKAASQCGETCGNEIRSQPSTPEGQAKRQQLLQVSQNCQQELQASNQRTGMALSEIATVLASLAKVMQALGIGQKDDVGLADINKPSDDPCEGQFADMLIECTGQSGPNSTRAGLNGSTLTGGLGGNGDGLFQSGSQGEPGGDRKGANKASTNVAGGGFAGAGMGAMGAGLGGLDSGSGGTSEQASGDINAEAQQGFMGTGGGSGGGGGGSSGGRSAPFSGFSKSSLNAEGQERAMIERKLNKLTSNSSPRAPASADGTNGPFQDNWTVINRAYKKNSSSMFHQK